MKEKPRSVPEPDEHSPDRMARIRAWLIKTYGETTEAVFMASPDALPEMKAAFYGFMAGWDSALMWKDEK